jgi:CRP/FNR family transcriptional regulator, cyclic AMP receptor protein
MDKNTRDILRNIGLFRDLTEEELTRVQSITTRHHYDRGEYVFMEGQTREAVYFVERGLIKVFKVDSEGREHIVNILGVSQMFPHVGLFDDSPYPGTAEILSSATLLSVRSKPFEELLLDNPETMRKLMKVLGKKILQLQGKLHELAVYDTHDRVSALLRHFAEEHGQIQSDGIHLKLPVTHAEMAQMIGSSRESVNRIWNEFRRKGIVAGDKDEWIVNQNWYNHS